MLGELYRAAMRDMSEHLSTMAARRGAGLNYQRNRQAPARPEVLLPPLVAPWMPISHYRPRAHCTSKLRMRPKSHLEAPDASEKTLRVVQPRIMTNAEEMHSFLACESILAEMPSQGLPGFRNFMFRVR